VRASPRRAPASDRPSRASACASRRSRSRTA
jgi:hypothetical protein